jgi:hypothetical protein
LDGRNNKLLTLKNNFMRDRDAKILTEMYSLVRENEEQQAATNIPPEAQQKAEDALRKIIDSLTPEQKEQLKQALQGGQDIQTALQAIQGQGGQQNVQAESYIEEGLGRRLMSRAAGLGGIKDNVLGAEPGKEKRDYQNDKLSKRYEIFKNAMGKHLKELQLDLKTVKNVDPDVKQKVDQIVTGLATSEMGGITPSTSKFQEFRHGAGRVVQGVGTAAAIAVPLGLLTAPLVTSLGTAAATKAGVGALTSVAMDLLNGQKPSWKKALAGAAIGGAVGAGMYGLQHAGDAAYQAATSGGNQPPVDTSNLNVKGNFMYNDPNAHVQPGVANIGANAPSPSGNEFLASTGTEYNPASHLDQAVNHIYKALDAKGIIGTTGPSHELVASPNFSTAVDKAFPHITSKTAEKIANLIANTDTAQLQQLQHGSQNAVINFLKTAVRR